MELISNNYSFNNNDKDISVSINKLRHIIDRVITRRCPAAFVDHANTISTDELDMSMFPIIIFVFDQYNFLK